MPFFNGTADPWWQGCLTTTATTGNDLYWNQLNNQTTTTATTTSGGYWLSQSELAELRQMHWQAENRLPEQYDEWSRQQADRREREATRRFNEARRNHAQKRAMERWRMGVRDPNLEHPQRILQRDAQARAVAQTAALREAGRDKARERAESLLLSCLTPEQLRTYNEKKWFVVEGGHSKTKYRINASEHMVANVDVLKDDGKVSHRLCAHLALGTVPPGDQLVAQKLMLEGNEEHFLRTANRHR